MKKIIKNCGILLLTICLLLSAVPVSAAQTDVTSKYKTSVTKFVRVFDGFLGCAAYTTNSSFTYNDYTKTTMLLYGHNWAKYGDSIKSAQKKLAPKMKYYFTSGNVRFVKSSTPCTSKHPEYVYCNLDGKVKYRGGDWSTEYPKGYVSRITKSGSDYIVKYNVYIMDSAFPTESGILMGQYLITLKRSSGHFKFKNIKQTKLNRWYQ